MGKDERLHLRLDSKARERLQSVCELTGLDEPTALRACVTAFIEYIEEHGEIRLPLRVVPKVESRAKKSEGAPAPSVPAARSIPAPSDSTAPHSLPETKRATGTRSETKPKS